MGERKAVEDRAHLHRDRLLVDVAAPHRLARRPRRIDAQPAPIGEHDVDAAVARLDFDVDARRAEHDRALQIEGPASQPARNCPEMLALAHVVDVIDMRGDGGDDGLRLARRDERREAVGEFLGDEAGRQTSRAPALVLHQRGEEGNVVADAVDDEGVERVRLRFDRGSGGRRRG